MNGQEAGMPERPGPFSGVPSEEKGFPIKKEDIKPMSPNDKMKTAKFLMLGLAVLFVVLVGLLLVSYVRFSNLKSECQYKLDYWVEKCAEKGIDNNLNITIPGLANITNPVVVSRPDRLRNRTNVTGATDADIMVTFE